MTDDLAPRALALELLGGVLHRHQPFDDLFDARIGQSALAGRDRGFVRLVVATALRRLGQLDAAIVAMLARPTPLKPEVLDLLRLGATQLLMLDTPAHAAVNTTVALAAANPATTPYKALINAVMRRLGREGTALVANQDAARLNTPGWLWQSWSAAYGAEGARAIAVAHLGEAPLDLSLKDASGTDEWARRLDALVLPTGTLRRAAGGAVSDLEGFAEGAWWIQDAAAALPAKLFGPALAGQLVYDLCAAPGGKTAQLAAAGARVVAVDRTARRLERLHDNLQRLGLNAETVVADATSWNPGPLADGVLLDAPCTATGTIRRHPDIPHLKGPSDVAKLSALQGRLISNAVGLLRPGGTLIYTVCSLQPEEGERQIAAALASGLPITRRPIAASEIGALGEMITPEGCVRTLPSHFNGMGGMDGFYICRLVANG